MTRRPAVFCTFVVVLVLSVLAVSFSVEAKPKDGNNSANAKLCQKGGWQLLQKADGTPFTSEQECVSYGATGGTVVPIPTATATPSSTAAPDPTATETSTPTVVPTATRPITPTTTPGPPTVHLFVFPVDFDPAHCEIAVTAADFPPGSTIDVFVESRLFPAEPGDEWADLVNGTIFANEFGNGLTFFTTDRTLRSVRAWVFEDEGGTGLVWAPEEPLLLC